MKKLTMIMATVMSIIAMTAPIKTQAFDMNHFAETVEEVKESRRIGEINTSDEEILKLAEIACLYEDGEAEIYYKAAMSPYGPYKVNVIAVVITDKVTYVQLATSNGCWDTSVTVSDADPHTVWMNARRAGYERL